MTDALPFATRTGGPLFFRWLRRPWLVLLVSCMATLPARTQEMPPVRQWDKTFGGSGGDSPNALLNTPDGGYLLGGSSGSDRSGDKSESGRGGSDYWVIKIDGNGNKQWDKTFGGSGSEMLTGLVAGPDGGYLLAGSSNAPAGGDKSEDSRGDTDYWVVKIDSSGDKVWDKTFGGSGADELNDLVATPDGGYLLGGTSNSGKGGDKSENGRGESDYWVVKLDGQGNVGWDKTLGSGANDFLSAVLPAGDGGYLVGGSSFGPAGGDKSEDGCTFDYWLVKLDGAGSKQWDRNFADYCSPDFLGDMAASPDGGFLLGGSIVEEEIAQWWVIKIDGNGNKQWEKYFNRGYDILHAVTATGDGGFALGGYSELFNYDYWLIKLDGLGNREWDKTLGGDKTDILNDLITTPDGGYLAGGYSSSDKSGDKSENSRGWDDFWVVKLVPLPTLRINAGGDAYTDARGKAYRADGYARGGSLTTPVAGEIARTEDDALYRQARYGERFTYSLPTGNGTYYVVLHFAETYWGHQTAGGAGSRQFHVDVEEARKLTDYDIFSRAGGALRAVQEAFRAEVRDGVLDIRFSRGAADFPLVAAIEVFPQENFRINVAGPAYFSSTQGWYLSDFYGTGGAVSQYAPGNVGATEDDELYRSNRHGSLFHYNLPTGPGTFRVTLHFNETYWGNLVPGGAGSRRFNVNAEGERKLTGYDTYQQSGRAMVAQQAQFIATVTDQVLNLAFLTGRDDGSVDFAHVAAIEVVKLPPAAATAARLAGEAMERVASPAVRLYPNPAGNILTVRLPFPAGPGTAVSITDAAGRVLRTSGYGWVGEKQLQWDVSSLGPGFYLLKVESGGDGQTFRFFKQ